MLGVTVKIYAMLRECAGTGAGQQGLWLGMKFNSNRTTRIVNSTPTIWSPSLSVSPSVFHSRPLWVLCCRQRLSLSLFALRAASIYFYGIMFGRGTRYVWQKWSSLAFGFTFRPDKLKLEHCPASQRHGVTLRIRTVRALQHLLLLVNAASLLSLYLRRLSLAANKNRWISVILSHNRYLAHIFLKLVAIILYTNIYFYDQIREHVKETSFSIQFKYCLRPPTFMLIIYQRTF